MELAEEGGFEAVRLRDAGVRRHVALGTLYRRFRSKEDLLVAALDREMSGLEERVFRRLPAGDTVLDRLTALFTLITRNFCRKPQQRPREQRALVSGDPELATEVAGFHERLERLIVAAMRGKAPTADEPPTEAERRLAWNMDLTWFALIISWSSGVRTPAGVIEHTRDAAALMLHGLDEVA